MRFIENLWAAQAKARKARGLVSQELDLDEPFQRARCYWSLFTQPPAHNGKVVMYIDEKDTFSEEAVGDSVLAFRIQAMPGGFTRFSYKTATGDEDRQVIDVSEVLEKTISTSKLLCMCRMSPPDWSVHKFGIFRFRTSISSAPSTPSSSHRLRPSMLHLDTISRNLFGAGSVNSRDRSSTLSSNRSKSTDSRISGDFKRTSDQSLSPGPYKMFADRSEVDLNERFNLARKNSNIAAYSPAKPPRSPLNGLLPVNTLLPTRGESTPKSPFSINSHLMDSPSEDTPIARRKAVSEDPTESLREASKSDRNVREWSNNQYDVAHLYRHPLLRFGSETEHLHRFVQMPLSLLDSMGRDHLLDLEDLVSEAVDLRHRSLLSLNLL